MRTWDRSLLSLTVCLCAGACGEGGPPRSQNVYDITANADAGSLTKPPIASASDASAGAPDAQKTSDSDSPGLVTQCPSLDAARCPDGLLGHWDVLLDASDFGEGAEFVALAGKLVLVRGGFSPFRVVELAPDYDGSGAATTRELTLAFGNYEALGVAPAARGGSGVELLACERTRGECLLMHASEQRTVLAEVAQSVLPAGFVPRGIVSGPELCVYGTGLLCWRNDDWVSVLDGLSVGEELAGVALGLELSMAVSSNGRLWHGQLDMFSERIVWSEQGALENATLSSLTVGGKCGLMLTSAGVVHESDGKETGCPEGSRFAAALLMYEGAQRQLLSQTGALFVSQQGGRLPWCAAGQVAFEGPVRAASSAPCGLDSNPRILTRTQLIGENRCGSE